MKRSKLNLIIDIILIVLFAINAFTGVLRFLGTVIRDDPNINPVAVFFHTYSGVLMVFFIAIHLALHWKMITRMFRNSFMTKEKAEN